MNKTEGFQPDSTTVKTIRIPECPVCWDTFNDSLHIPRLLQCGHTICQKCLGRLLFDAGVGRLCVRCPECRGLCMWHGLQELPKNYILLRVMNSSPFRIREGLLSMKTLATFCEQVRDVGLPNFVGSWLLIFVERRVREVAKLLWAISVMLVLVPLSFTHVVLSWWTAFLGCFIFIGASVGGIGLAVFMFFVWCTMSVVNILRWTWRCMSHWLPCK